jgi:hypothetical protein
MRPLRRQEQKAGTIVENHRREAASSPKRDRAAIRGPDVAPQLLAAMRLAGNRTLATSPRIVVASCEATSFCLKMRYGFSRGPESLRLESIAGDEAAEPV